jgi:AbrB family looped-hinge helix DNA binding protein
VYRDDFSDGVWLEFDEVLISIHTESMKIGERGRVTIPEEIRVRFGLGPETEVEFRVVEGAIVLRKKPKTLNLKEWKGRARRSFAELGYSSVDRFIEDIRGR